jgi:hypothetical protein
MLTALRSALKVPMLAMMMEDEEECEIGAHRERSSEMGCWLCLRDIMPVLNPHASGELTQDGMFASIDGVLLWFSFPSPLERKVSTALAGPWLCRS